MSDITKHWWKLPRVCVKCGGVNIDLTDILWARNGDIKIVGTCSNCDTVLHFDTDHNLVLEFCTNKDWCKHYDEKIRQMADTPAPLLNSEDLKLLKDFHIEGGANGT